MLLQGTGSCVFLGKFLASPSLRFYFNKNRITSHCSWKDRALDAYHPGAAQIAEQHAVRHRRVVFSLLAVCRPKEKWRQWKAAWGQKGYTPHTRGRPQGRPRSPLPRGQDDQQCTRMKDQFSLEHGNHHSLGREQLHGRVCIFFLSFFLFKFN